MKILVVKMYENSEGNVHTHFQKLNTSQSLCISEANGLLKQIRIYFSKQGDLDQLVGRPFTELIDNKNVV